MCPEDLLPTPVFPVFAEWLCNHRSSSQTLAAILLSTVSESALPPLPKLVQKALFHLHRDLSQSIHETATLLECSDRHLRRQFVDTIGLPPKEYQQLHRIWRATHYMYAHSDIQLSQLALEHGFSDQAHFQRTFKEFTTMTPRQFLLSIHG